MNDRCLGNFGLMLDKEMVRFKDDSTPRLLGFGLIGSRIWFDWQ